MKQTAVEFLIDTWVKNGTLKGEDMFQAKEMEKEHMILIYKAAFQDWFNGELFDFEQYYNETYKNTNE